MDSGIFKAITQFKKDDCVDNKQNIVGTESISKYNTSLVEGCCDFFTGT
jgi:hypothetical protein